MHSCLADLKKNVAGFDARAKGWRFLHDFCHLGAGAFLEFLGLGDIDADPAVPRFAETNEIIPDFLRGIDGQSMAGRAVFNATNEYADDFSLEIQDWRASLSALRGNVHAQMRCGELTSEKFPIESRDHPEIWCLR